MTMLDEDRLSALLGRAAASFEVPAAGPDEIVARSGRGAADGEPIERGEGDAADVAHRARKPCGPGRPARRRLVASAGRHRILTVAACLVVALLVAGTIGAVVRSSTGPDGHLGAPGARRHGAGRSQPATTTRPARTPARPLAAGPAFGTNGTSFGAQSTAGSAGTSAKSAAPDTPALPHGSVGQSAKIEQTGSLGLTVGRGDLARTLSRLRSLATSVGGFVANSQSQRGSGGAAYGTITLQVPVDSFPTVLAQAEQYGKASNVSTKATDVTGRYVDLQARLAALEVSRQQYLTILAKATSIGDILAVQEQLDSIQSQIEQLQGQLQVLASETSYSTLNVTVSERGAPPQPGPLPESGLVRAWHDSVGGFVAGVEGTVRLAGPLLFALLCVAVVAVGGRQLWRRSQRHRL